MIVDVMIGGTKWFFDPRFFFSTLVEPYKPLMTRKFIKNLQELQFDDNYLVSRLKYSIYQTCISISIAEAQIGRVPHLPIQKKIK